MIQMTPVLLLSLLPYRHYRRHHNQCDLYYHNDYLRRIRR